MFFVAASTCNSSNDSCIEQLSEHMLLSYFGRILAGAGRVTMAWSRRGARISTKDG